MLQLYGCKENLFKIYNYLTLIICNFKNLIRFSTQNNIFFLSIKCEINVEGFSEMFCKCTRILVYIIIIILKREIYDSEAEKQMMN